MHIFGLIILGLMSVVTVGVMTILLSSVIGFSRTKVPFIPTARQDIETISQRIGISKTDVVYDLGSGNGKVLFVIEQLTEAQAVGFELTHWTHWYARMKRWLIHSRAQFVRGDFFQTTWSPATVIYTYLYPPLMRSVGEKIQAECRPGTIIIARDFPIPNLSQINYFTTYGNHEVFVYRL